MKEYVTRYGAMMNDERITLTTRRVITIARRYRELISRCTIDVFDREMLPSLTRKAAMRMPPSASRISLTRGVNFIRRPTSPTPTGYRGRFRPKLHAKYSLGFAERPRLIYALNDALTTADCHTSRQMALNCLPLKHGKFQYSNLQSHNSATACIFSYQCHREMTSRR